MDLKNPTQKYDAIYVIDWHYKVFLIQQVFIYFYRSMAIWCWSMDDQDNDYVNSVICNVISIVVIILLHGSFRKMPLEILQRELDYDIAALTDLRYPEGSVIRVWIYLKILHGMHSWWKIIKFNINRKISINIDGRIWTLDLFAQKTIR